MNRKCWLWAQPTHPPFFLTLVVLMPIFLASCTGTKSGTRTTLRLSMIPSTDPGKIVRESQLFIDYLQKETGAKVELTVPTNYAAVVEAVANDRVDIAYFGGFTYVQASARAGVRPLVQRERDQVFHSVFITPASSPIRALA